MGIGPCGQSGALIRDGTCSRVESSVLAGYKGIVVEKEEGILHAQRIEGFSSIAAAENAVAPGIKVPRVVAVAGTTIRADNIAGRNDRRHACHLCVVCVT